MWVNKRAALAATRAEPIATAVPRQALLAAPFDASASLGSDCHPKGRAAAHHQRPRLTSGKDAGQVQFRKASREFGAREKRGTRAAAVRVAHTLASISCMRAT